MNGLDFGSDLITVPNQIPGSGLRFRSRNFKTVFLMKFFGEVGRGTRNNQLDFW